MDRKVICFFPGALNLGGIGKLTINLAKYYAKEGYIVHLYLTKKEGEYLNSLDESIKIFIGKGSAIRSFFSFYQYLKKEKPDVVVSSRDYLNLMVIIFNKVFNFKFKHIPSVHVDYRAIPQKEKFLDKILLFVYRFFYKKADMVVAVSRGVADNFADKYKFKYEKIKVIYNPVYDPQMYINESEVNYLSFFQDNIPIIIGVGRFTAQKNFELLIKAFNEVNKVKEVKLLLLGDGVLRDNLESLVSALEIQDRVLMPGFVSNPQAYISLSDVFVLPSNYEGFGNVLVEAMGTGITVVSTDCYSGPSEILEGGKYGILAEVGNVEQLKLAILKGLESPFVSKEIIDRAKEFSIEKIATIYQKYF